MNHAQITAFTAGSGGIAPSDVKYLIVGIFLLFCFSGRPGRYVPSMWAGRIRKYGAVLLALLLSVRSF